MSTTTQIILHCMDGEWNVSVNRYARGEGGGASICTSRDDTENVTDSVALDKVFEAIMATARAEGRG